MNDHLVLIGGKAATGKSASLMSLAMDENGTPRPVDEQRKVLYLCTEAGKRLPFSNKFLTLNVTDPCQVPQAIAEVETDMPDVEIIVIDSLTYMMDQYESIYVLPSSNGMKAWGDFAQFFKTLMQQTVASSSKTIIFTAHTQDLLNEGEMIVETKVPVKGSLKANGIESYFSIVIATKKMPLPKLKEYQSSLLHITEEDELNGYKHVFQTRLTKETVNERIRSPIGLFARNETFIDNDISLVHKRLNEYYKD